MLHNLSPIVLCGALFYLFCKIFLRVYGRKRTSTIISKTMVVSAEIQSLVIVCKRKIRNILTKVFILGLNMHPGLAVFKSFKKITILYYIIVDISERSRGKRSLRKEKVTLNSLKTVITSREMERSNTVNAHFKAKRQDEFIKFTLKNGSSGVAYLQQKQTVGYINYEKNFSYKEQVKMMYKGQWLACSNFWCCYCEVKGHLKIKMYMQANILTIILFDSYKGDQLNDMQVVWLFDPSRVRHRDIQKSLFATECTSFVNSKYCYYYYVSQSAIVGKEKVVCEQSVAVLNKKQVLSISNIYLYKSDKQLFVVKNSQILTQCEIMVLAKVKDNRVLMKLLALMWEARYLSFVWILFKGFYLNWTTTSLVYSKRYEMIKIFMVGLSGAVSSQPSISFANTTHVLKGAFNVRQKLFVKSLNINFNESKLFQKETSKIINVIKLSAMHKIYGTRIVVYLIKFENLFSSQDRCVSALKTDNCLGIKISDFAERPANTEFKNKSYGQTLVEDIEHFIIRIVLDIFTILNLKPNSTAEWRVSYVRNFTYFVQGQIINCTSQDILSKANQSNYCIVSCFVPQPKCIEAIFLSKQIYDERVCSQTMGRFDKRFNVTEMIWFSYSVLQIFSEVVSSVLYIRIREDTIPRRRPKGAITMTKQHIAMKEVRNDVHRHWRMATNERLAKESAKRTPKENTRRNRAWKFMRSFDFKCEPTGSCSYKAIPSSILYHFRTT